MVDHGALVRLILLIVFCTVVGALAGAPLVGLAVGVGIGLLAQFA